MDESLMWLAQLPFGLCAISSPRLKEARVFLTAMETASDVGREAVRVLDAGKPPVADWLPAQLAKLDEAARPHAACELPIIVPLKLLVAAAALQQKHPELSDEAWGQLLKDTIAAPAKP